MTSNETEVGALSKAWHEVRSLFGAARRRGTSAPPVSPSVPAGDEARAVPDGASSDFGDRLAALKDHGPPLDTVVAGRVHLFNLDAVKARMGPRWQRARERVHNLIESELDARLSRRDFYSRRGEDSYLIVFGEADEAEARLKIALLGEAILSKLFGASDAEDLRALSVHSVVAKADGELAAEALGSPDALLGFLEQEQRRQSAAGDAESDEARAALGLSETEIDGLIEYLGAQLGDSGPGTRTPGGQLHTDRLHEILKQLHALESQLARRLDELISDDAPERPEIALSPGLMRVAHRSLVSLRDLRRQAETQLAEARLAESRRAAPGFVREDGEPAPQDDAPGRAAAGEADGGRQSNFAIGYRPIWHAPSQRAGIYLAEARLLGAEGETVEGEEALFDEELEEAIDRLVLLQGRRELEQSRAAQTPAVLAVPVHYQTLARIGSQRRYLDLCRNIRAEHRRHIIWQIVDVPRQAFQGQLRGFVELLRPFGRACFVMIAITEQTYPHLARDLPTIALAGVAAVGLDARRTGAGEADQLKLFDYLAKLAERAKLKCSVVGLESRSLVIGATCAGIEYLAGSAVLDSVPHLAGVRRAALAQIYFDQFGKIRPELVEA